MPRYIKLGYPLDLLFNRECKFNDYKDNINEIDFKKNESTVKYGGLALPEENFTGSGNIIIRGKPGTAKSTLAMQLAVSAGFNNLYSFYITLEESPDNTLKKVSSFGWDSTCTVLNELCNNELGDQTYIENLILNCKIDHKVIISSLSPRNIFKENNNDNLLFHDRYKQLERILIETSIYNKKVKDNRVGVICIDSLNVFGDSLLSRTEIFRLFELFKQYEVLGIFIVEEDEKFLFSSDNKLHSETIEYVADIVISLTTGEDDGYLMRYFEITKSRYQHQVYGKHPFKIMEVDKSNDSGAINAVKVFKVFPSLHYIVYGTDISEDNKPNNSQDIEKEAFWDKEANYHLSKEHKKNSSLLIEGPRDTFKTSLARDFLLRGFSKDGDKTGQKHVLFIRFQDYHTESDLLKAFRISQGCMDSNDLSNILEIDSEDKVFLHLKKDKSSKSTKRFLSSYTANNIRFTELVFQSGYVLPEEFIQILLETILIFEEGNNQKELNIKRIVIDEIGRIGSSYPLLFKSKTAGDLFLTALSHIIRNYRIKLLITGTTGEYTKSDEVINKVKTIVDDVLTTKKINVFGDNYVTLQGGTLTSTETAKEHEYSDENVPGVIIPTKDYLFKVDNTKFIGLVGFGTEKIDRPGLGLFMVEENGSIHADYNNGIRKMLGAVYTSLTPTFYKDVCRENNIGVISYKDVYPYHEALDIIKGSPIDKTVLYMVDEFYRNISHKEFYDSFLGINKRKVDGINNNEGKAIFDSDYLNSCGKKKDEEKIYSFPYYNNVLFIAVDKSKLHENEINETDFYESFKNWESILNLANRIKDHICPIDICFSAKETLSCVLLDVLINCSKMEIDKDNETKLIDILEKFKNDASLNTDLIDELSALGRLFFMSDKVKQEVLNEDYILNTIDKKSSKIDKLLSPHSFMHICWYSELRELLSRNPGLSDKLEIFPLPGKGFKGDWHIGILNGSVSANLGLRVIEKLCNKNEDFKRFTLGIGLPTRKKFYEKDEGGFLAWPNSKIETEKKYRSNLIGEKDNKKYSNLALIYKIHEQAHERAKINGYIYFKEMLAALFKELILIEYSINNNSYENEKINEDERNKRIQEIIIDRLNPLYEVLC